MQKLILKFQNFSQLSIENPRNNINEFSGYASVFNKVDSHNDIIVKGAFFESIENVEEIKLLWQHKQDSPIGKIISISEDEHGLLVKGEFLNELKYAEDAITLIKNQIIDGLSIGFIIKESEYDNEGNRIIKKAILKEVSVVTFPANLSARIIKNNIKKEDNYMINKDVIENISYKTAYSNSDQSEKITEFVKSSGIASLEIKSLNGSLENEGGALIGGDLHNKIISNLGTKSPLRTISSVEQISGSYIDFVIENGEFSSGWVAELAERPETKTSKLIQKRISVHELYAQPKATQKLMQDSAINFNSWLLEQISDSFIKKENESFLHGDGDNKPKGILVNNEIKAISSEGNESISVQDILNLVNDLDEKYMNKVSFLMNRSTLSVIQNFRDNNGRFIYQSSVSESMKETLFGIPIYCCSYMPKIENGKVPIIFGNFKAGYKILDRNNVTITRDPYTDKPFIKFYAVKRVGGDVLDSKALRKLQIKNK